MINFPLTICFKSNNYDLFLTEKRSINFAKKKSPGRHRFGDLGEAGAPREARNVSQTPLTTENAATNPVNQVTDEARERIKLALESIQVVQGITAQLDLSVEPKQIAEQLEKEAEKLDELSGYFNNIHAQLDESQANLEKLYTELKTANILSQEQLDQFLDNNTNKKLFDKLKTIVAAHASRPEQNAAGQPLPKFIQSDLESLMQATPETFLETVKLMAEEPNKKFSAEERAAVEALKPKTEAEKQQSKWDILKIVKAKSAGLKRNYYWELTRGLATKQDTLDSLEKANEDFIKTSEKITELTNTLLSETKNSMKRGRNLKDLSEETGIPLQKAWKENLELEMDDIDYAANDLNTIVKGKQVIKITDIFYEDIEMFDGQGNTIGFAPSLEPKIEINWQREGGITASGNENQGTRVFTAREFRLWVAQQDVTPRVKNLEELAKNLGLENQIQEGKKFELSIPKSRDDKGKVTYENKTITISQIDEKNQTITLDSAVELQAANHQAGISPRVNNVLTFGQFAKWYRKYQILPQIDSLQDLNVALRQHTEDLNQQYSRDPSLYPPIDLESELPIVLMYEPAEGDATPYVVKKIENDQIHFDNGEIKSFTDFLRWVKKNEVELGSPEIRAKRFAEMKEIDAAEKQKEVEIAEKKFAEEMVQRASSGKLASTSEKAPPSLGYFRKLWNNTTLLNLNNIINIAKKIWNDFIMVKLKRISDNNEGSAIEKIFTPIWPDLGGQGKAMRQSNEQQGVDDLVKLWAPDDASDSWGRLENAANPIQLKAAIQMLCDKGAMDWNREKVHHKLNQLLYYTYPATHPLRGHRIVVGQIPDAWKDKTNLQEQIKLVLNQKYGLGTYQGFYSNNISKYGSNKSTAQSQGPIINSVEEGGVGFKMQKILVNFMDGAPESPAEYDGYLTYMIKAGIFTVHQYIYYLTLGFSLKNEDGLTLLNESQLSDYFNLINDVPVFNYFAGFGHIQCDAKGIPVKPIKKGAWGVNNFIRLYNDVCSKDNKESLPKTDPRKYEPGSNTFNYVTREMFADYNTRQRIRKTSSNPTYDVDSYQFYIPLFPEGAFSTFLNIRTGRAPNPAGIQNSYVGFNAQLIQRAEALKETQDPGKQKEQLQYLAEMCRGFIVFDSIVSGRYGEPGLLFALDGNDYDNRAPAESNGPTVRQYRDETRNFIFALAKSLGLEADARIILYEGARNDPGMKGESNFAKAVDRRLKEFNNTLQVAMKKALKENPSEFFATLTKNTKGMTGTSGGTMTPEQKRQAEEAMNRAQALRDEVEPPASDFNSPSQGAAGDYTIDDDTL